MTIWAFSGTRHPRLEDLERIADWIEECCVLGEDSFITGAALGVDAWVATYGRQRGFPVHTIVPAVPTFTLDPYFREHADQLTWLEPSAEPYRARNAEMGRLCDRLIAFAAYPDGDGRSTRSGTWMTVQLARKAGKSVTVVVLRDRGEGGTP